MYMYFYARNFNGHHFLTLYVFLYTNSDMLMLYKYKYTFDTSMILASMRGCFNKVLIKSQLKYFIATLQL